MNHDYAHCIDYKEGACPTECFRVELARDYRQRLPVSFMSFKGTEECMLKREDNDGDK